MPGYLLANAHWPDVDAEHSRLPLVPVASLEEHGAYLPLDNEARIRRPVAELGRGKPAHASFVSLDFPPLGPLLGVYDGGSVMSDQLKNPPATPPAHPPGLALG